MTFWLWLIIGFVLGVVGPGPLAYELLCYYAEKASQEVD